VGVKIAYADPPYPGEAKRRYGSHADYAGEVDHVELIERMTRDYDGWVLHTASTALPLIVPLCPAKCRFAAWVKPFAAFKNPRVAYAWEPVIFWDGRKRPREALTVRDWVAEPITLKRGLTGAKPEAVCRWAFEVLGMRPDDELVDLFPGTGAVQRAWEAWRAAPPLPGIGPREDATTEMVA
jgi:hypothetical protein